jgi:RNA polymerase sigma-70 factor (ECF subfamily)
MKPLQVRSQGVVGTETRTRPAADQIEALYRSTRDDVFAYATTLLRDRAAAEEVTAVAFERALSRQWTFDRRRGEARAWLFGIVRNAALDELRRRRRLAALVADPVAEEGDEPADDDGELTLRRTAVAAALAGLSPRERELIALKFHAGLSNREIARVLGTSESNAGTLLHRAMTAVRRACDAT